MAFRGGGSLVCVLALLPAALQAQRAPSVTPQVRGVVQGTLTAPGATPFHLHASIVRGRDRTPYGQFDVVWTAPEHFRRTIDATDFHQTIIVNGSDIFEEDTPKYFPLQLRTLITAALDPTPILAAVRPGDRVSTKASGAVEESGRGCFNQQKTMCGHGTGGLRETVAASGHSVTFGGYQPFHGLRIARILTNGSRLGEEPMELRVTVLEDSVPGTSFAVKEPTPPAQQLHFVVLSSSDLHQDAAGPQDIIWPQALDGGVSGPASFYISFDTGGVVREVQQLYTVNERTNESAINQLKRWTFKPATQDGLPAQGEGVIEFTVNTRAYGPRDFLTNEQARKLATGIVEPGLPAGKFPPGTIYTLDAAIDADGHVIEVIAPEQSPAGFFSPCYDALRQWRFSPIMEDGQPRPYRAHIAFRFP